MTERVFFAGFGQAVALAFPDGKRLFIPDTNARLRVLDTDTLQLLNEISLDGDKPYGIAISPDGKRVYTTTIRQTRARWSTPKPAFSWPPPTWGTYPYDIAVDDVGKVCVTQYEDGTVTILSRPSNSLDLAAAFWKDKSDVAATSQRRSDAETPAPVI